MVADAAGCVLAGPLCFGVLERVGFCWEMLLQACVSVCVMRVHICPLGQCQEPRVNTGSFQIMNGIFEFFLLPLSSFSW